MSPDGPRVAHKIWNDQRHYNSTSTCYHSGHFGHLESNGLHSVETKHSSSSSPLHVPESLETSPVDRHSESPVYKGSKARHSRPVAAAFHPYKSSQGPSPLPQLSLPPQPLPPFAPAPKPIQFIDATFQPGDPNNLTQTTNGGLAYCRPKRKKIIPSQLTRLLEVFQTTDNPGFDLRDSVGQEIGMSNREVQVWFQNRRAKVTREKANALEKANPSRPRLLSNERLPASTRSSPTPEPPQSQSASSSLSAAQHQWKFSSTQPSLPPSIHSSQAPLESHRSSSDAVPRYRKMFGNQRILLPRSSSPLPSPEVSSAASEASSYFTNVATPPLSYTATTPGTESPKWTATRNFASSANTNEHGRLELSSKSPLPFGSPSTAFGQLALRSPPIHSTLSERQPFFHAVEMPSPPLPEPEEFIRLAPIRSSWDASATPRSSTTFVGGRRRSLSTPDLIREGRVGGGGGAEGERSDSRSSQPRAAHARLPSIRDLLNPVSVGDNTSNSTPALTPSFSSSSSSTSPVTPFSGSPFSAPSTRLSTPVRPPLSARHTTDVVPSAHRFEHRRYPSSERGLTGLGVVHSGRVLSPQQYYPQQQQQQRPHSMFNPY
ncbi:hypothetical protein JCM3765_002728 [Sporobolomyces pararoseus]